MSKVGLIANVKLHFYQPQSEGDNVLGSIRLSVSHHLHMSNGSGRSNGSAVRPVTDGQTVADRSGQTDGRTQPSTLSSIFVPDKNRSHHAKKKKKWIPTFALRLPGRPLQVHALKLDPTCTFLNVTKPFSQISERCPHCDE